MDNRALGPALAVAFQKAGGRLLANEAVVRIERREGRAAIAHTPFGLYHADALSWRRAPGADCWKTRSPRSTPVKGQMIVLTPPPDASPPGPVIWGDGIYAVPRGPGAGDRRHGGRGRLRHQHSPMTARDSLRGAAEKLMPALRDWTVGDHWAGLRPRAPDGLPLLGPTAVDGLWLASGQYRNGILFAPAIAETCRDQILGRAKASPPSIPAGSRHELSLCIPAWQPTRLLSPTGRCAGCC